MQETFTATSGTPYEKDVTHYSESASVNQWSIQNDGDAEITVKGKLKGATNWATLGTVEANTIKPIALLKGLAHIRIEGDATGIIIG